jgi:hypothetical protein
MFFLITGYRLYQLLDETAPTEGVVVVEEAEISKISPFCLPFIEEKTGCLFKEISYVRREDETFVFQS